MSIKISIPHFLVNIADNKQAVEVKGATVGECLDDLVSRFPQLTPWIFDQNHRLQKHLDIWINDETGGYKGLVQPVIDGDRLTIVSIISGG